MIDDATVTFTNGKSVDVERVKFKDSGFVGVRMSDGWAYYPPQRVKSVLPNDD